ncbi:MAG: MATE family efflux transporter, partial [Clostridiales bacterium]|nr:MATE family efflux transporter [Clostridiales bacterium]
IISQGISALLVTSCLMKSDGPCKLVLKELKIDLPTLKDITLIGLPAGLQSSLFSISNVIIQSSVNSFGDIVMSGNTAASNIDGFINVSENAIYQAALTFTGQNFGAKKYKRTKKIMWTCLASTVVLVSVISVIIYIFRTQLLGIYLPDEPEAISYGAFRMELVTLFYFVFGANDVLVGQLRGLGKSLYPMLISVFGICGVRIIWIYTVFKQTHTLEMLYISYPLSWLVSFLGMLLCYFIVSRKLPADGEVANI